MREMKDSGSAWIGNMPQDWNLVRMKSCITSRDSGAWGNESKGDEGDIICLRIADFDYGRFSFKDTAKENLTIRNYTPDVIKNLLLKKDDILIEKSGGGEKTPVGRTVIFDKEYPALYANFMDRLRCSDIVFPRFMQYVFVTFYKNRYTWNYIKQTTGIQNLDLTSMLATEQVALPPLPEQQRIAAYLDTQCARIDDVLAKTRASIEEYKRLKQAVIDKYVLNGLKSADCAGNDLPKGWRYIKLKFVTTDIVDCPHETPEYSFDGEYLVIRTADQDLAKLRTEKNMYRLSESEYKNRIRRLPLNKGDIVYGREGERWGYACVIPENGKFCLGQRMMQFRCNQGICIPEYMVYALSTTFVHRQGEVDTFGSTSPHVNISTIRNYFIPVPPMDEQIEISKKLDEKCAAIDALIAKKEAFLTELETYKKSMIYEYVTGKKEVPMP